MIVTAGFAADDRYTYPEMTATDAPAAPLPQTGGRPAIRLSPAQASHRGVLLAKISAGEWHLEDVPACLCGGSEAVAVAHQDRYGIPVGVVVCRDCGLLRTTPRLAAEHLPAFYETVYHGLHFGLAQPTERTTLVRHGQGAAIYSYVSAGAGWRPGTRISVIDIGAGNGAVLREFAAAAAADGVEVDAIGCEYSSAFAASAQRLGTNVLVGGIETLLESAPPADLVIMSHVVEHFADPPNDLRLVRSLVTSRTQVYVEVPGVLTIHTKPQYDYTFAQYFTLAHTYHFTLATLVAAMQRSGFRFLRGDEEVRALFAPAADDDPPAPVSKPTAEAAASPSTSAMAYLAWLEGSRRLQIRRAVLRTGRGARRIARMTARRVLGEQGTRTVRRLLRR
jgi:SAM-dependent methyltransferase